MYHTTNYKISRFLTYFKNFSKIRWIFLTAFFIFLVAFGFFISKVVIALITNTTTNDGDQPWKIVDKFTYQSNILLLVFAFFFVFLPNHQFLKSDSFLIATMVYIFFTFFGYNLILNFIGGGYPNPVDDPYGFISSFWVHLVTPLTFIGCGLAKFYLEPKQIKLKNFSRVMLFGMIYPTIYLIYVATIPFVLHNSDNSVYSVYGKATNTVDNPAIAWPTIIGMYLIFFPGSFALFYFLAKFIRKKRLK